MQISITVPTKAQIINGGFVVPIAAHGAEWSKTHLGDYTDRSGVYILHSNGRILYVGKTTQGEYGNFGERLRHQCLLSQAVPVRAYLLDLSDLDMMIDQGPMTLSPVRKALIMEQALIGIYEPPENESDASVG